MADSRYWRRPGRRDEERARFANLMLELERVRIREGLSKAELARRLKTTKDVIYDWLSGKMIGRKASVERIEEFLTGMRWTPSSATKPSIDSLAVKFDSERGLLRIERLRMGVFAIDARKPRDKSRTGDRVPLW
jgi:transcriptional regulator with XRE-family HTH domain